MRVFRGYSRPVPAPVVLAIGNFDGVRLGHAALIRRLAESQGMTIVVVTHELASIAAIADRAIMLDRDAKGVIAMGTPAELAQHPDPRVQRFFRREAENIG